MPRKRKGDPRIISSETEMREGVSLVVEQNYTLRHAAESTGLKYQTLARYVKKFKANNDVEMKPNLANRQIFNEAQESVLLSYAINCSKMFYGLTAEDVRKLAYEMAVKNNLKVPDSWHSNKIAGVEWLRSFRLRHPQTSMRIPEGCSMARAAGFNRIVVGNFFDNLEEVMSRNDDFRKGIRVYNLDETKTTTVQVHSRVLAEKGQKQVSKLTSAERGVLTTTCVIVCAQGYAIPPAMVFKRKHFVPELLVGCVPGTLGLVSPTGWMTSELFVKVMEHFIAYSGATRDNPVLLIYDNHESHLSLRTTDLEIR